MLIFFCQFRKRRFIQYTALTRKCWKVHPQRTCFLHRKSKVNMEQKGRAMAQAVSRRPLTAETRVRSRVSPCGICGGQSGTGTGFSPSTSVFPCQFHSTGALLHGKTKIKLIIFITRLHNNREGCGASVAFAAGPSKNMWKRNILTSLLQKEEIIKFKWGHYSHNASNLCSHKSTLYENG
jgi:hypothetical protein